MNFGSSDGRDNNKIDPQLAQELQAQQLEAEIQQRINNMSSMCWDICVGKPSDKMDSRTENCLEKCVLRFVDASFLVQNRLMEKLQGGRMG